jgi:AcrR family transcriptional regulator
MPRPAVATRERILRAAFTRFASYGFRRTSMEDIAEAAGVSRAALYLQFRNKEAIFRALSEDLHGESLAGAEAALAKVASLAERLRAAVEAKTLRFVEIAYGSPHGSELLDESNRLCGDLAAATEVRYRALLARVFRRAAEAGEVDLAAAALTPPAAAELFMRSISGLKGPGVTVEAYRERVAALVRVFAAGLRPTDTTRPPARSRRPRPGGPGGRLGSDRDKGAGQRTNDER